MRIYKITRKDTIYNMKNKVFSSKRAICFFNLFFILLSFENIKGKKNATRSLELRWSYI